MSRVILTTALIGLAIMPMVACAESPDSADPTSTHQAIPVTTAAAASASADSSEFPDVLDAKLTPAGNDFRVVVTMSSPYDTPERYADGWRVLTPGGDVLAEHVLHHDHQHEQPFTRSRGPFTIPDDADEVVVEGRDSANGYGGDTVTVAVPR